MSQENDEKPIIFIFWVTEFQPVTVFVARRQYYRISNHPTSIFQPYSFNYYKNPLTHLQKFQNRIARYNAASKLG